MALASPIVVAGYVGAIVLWLLTGRGPGMALIRSDAGAPRMRPTKRNRPSDAGPPTSTLDGGDAVERATDPDSERPRKAPLWQRIVDAVLAAPLSR